MRTTRRYVIVAVTLVAAGCAGRPETALEGLVAARQQSADLLVQFTKAADAANLAVMADTDEASVGFAREADLTSQAVQKNSEALRRTLLDLGYSEEVRLLVEFNTAFGAYRALDRTILGLAVENTNLKAQRLSFGSGQEEADALRTSVEAVSPAASSDAWRVKALTATVVASVREIQVLQGPHIAEPDDATMSRLEKQMAASEAAARSSLQMLGTLASDASRSQLMAAGAALNRFVATNAQIVALSRRNTNVRSLALSLGQKRTLAATCEESLRALQADLAKRQIGGTR